MTLPTGFTVRLAHDVRTAHEGRLLVGGAPLTALRLTPRATRLLRRGRLTVTDTGTAHLAERLLATNLAHPDLTRVPAAAPHELTVVMPVRDRPHQLDRALSALAGVRCVVVDDASRDGAAVADVCRRHGATWIPLDHNVGPAAARNVGTWQVTTPYVAFVDSDVQVSAADLLQLTRHFQDPAVALVGPRVAGRSTAARPRWFERYDEDDSALDLGHRPGNVRPGAAVAWLPSACLVARTSALGSGFAPQLRVGEDVDLVWRIVRSGHRVRYDPAVTAGHDTRATMRGWLGRTFVYGTSGASLAARHGNLVAPAVLTGPYAAAAAALLLRTRWSPLLTSVAVAHGARQVRSALPDHPGRTAMAARISTRGLAWAVRQESALAVRHWWPAALATACFVRPARRVLVSALVVDTGVALAERRHRRGVAGPVDSIAARRLNDLAYGAGLWWGALRHRSPRALLPRGPGLEV